METILNGKGAVRHRAPMAPGPGSGPGGPTGIR